jgi:hypothetical protein
VQYQMCGNGTLTEKTYSLSSLVNQKRGNGKLWMLKRLWPIRERSRWEIFRGFLLFFVSLYHCLLNQLKTKHLHEEKNYLLIQRNYYSLEKEQNQDPPQLRMQSEIAWYAKSQEGWTHYQFEDEQLIPIPKWANDGITKQDF